MSCLTFSARPQYDYKFVASPAGESGFVVITFGDVVVTFESVAVVYASDEVLPYIHPSIEALPTYDFVFGALPCSRLSFAARSPYDFTFNVKLVCNVPTYLQIRPELIWVYEDLSAQNDVLSNTNWNIN